MKKIILFVILTILFVASCSRHKIYQPPKHLPPLMLWAWEAPQNFSLISTKTTGVAALILSININQNNINYYTRQQPLKLAANTYIIGVVHIEKPPIKLPLSRELAKYIATRIKNEYQKANYKELQIDFDAVTSEHQFYTWLLNDLRDELGHNTIISITAIASWCTNDRWILDKNLPIDYIVPMFFSLNGNKNIRDNFIKNFDQKNIADYCQKSIGLSTFEKWDVPIKTKYPVFIYTTGSWDIGTFEKANWLRQQHSINNQRKYSPVNYI